MNRDPSDHKKTITHRRGKGLAALGLSTAMVAAVAAGVTKGNNTADCAVMPLPGQGIEAVTNRLDVAHVDHGDPIAMINSGGHVTSLTTKDPVEAGTRVGNLSTVLNPTDVLVFKGVDPEACRGIGARVLAHFNQK